MKSTVASQFKSEKMIAHFGITEALIFRQYHIWKQNRWRIFLEHIGRIGMLFQMLTTNFDLVHAVLFLCSNFTSSQKRMNDQEIEQSSELCFLKGNNLKFPLTPWKFHFTFKKPFCHSPKFPKHQKLLDLNWVSNFNTRVVSLVSLVCLSLPAPTAT